MGTKRLAATILWFFAGWTLGNVALYVLGQPLAVSPVFGVLAAAVVFVDPMHVLWTARPAHRPATLSTIPPATVSSESEKRAA